MLLLFLDDREESRRHRDEIEGRFLHMKEISELRG
jgi:hypothetical protein